MPRKWIDYLSHRVYRTRTQTYLYFAVCIFVYVLLSVTSIFFSFSLSLCNDTITEIVIATALVTSFRHWESERWLKKSVGFLFLLLSERIYNVKKRCNFNCHPFRCLQKNTAAYFRRRWISATISKLNNYTMYTFNIAILITTTNPSGFTINILFFLIRKRCRERWLNFRVYAEN